MSGRQERIASKRATRPKLRITNNGFKRFYAVYERVGDRTTPIVTEVALDSSFEGFGSVEYVVMFSEDVVGVDHFDFGFDAVHPAGAVVESVTGSGMQRRVRVRLKGAAGGSKLAARDNDSVLDLGGNSLGGDGKDNGGIASAVLELLYIGSLVGEPTDEGFALALAGENGQVFEFQGSDNLAQWSPLGQATIVDGTASFVDTSPGSGRSRYYRVVLVE